MFVKTLANCSRFIANDGCEIQELLHPKNDSVDLPYSIAIAHVAIGKSSYQHKLKQTEAYHILSGEGLLHVDDDNQLLKMGDVAVIPSQAIQWIENTGEVELIFAAIVSPPWQEKDDVRL